MMKNIVKYMMAAAVLTAAFPVLAQNLPDGVYEEPVDAQGKSKGIAFRKSATLKPGTTDTYVIDLEAFVTGSVTVESKSVPADIVLVLDVSGSMNDHMYSAPYTARNSQNYSFGSIYNLEAGNDLFYRYTDGNYYKVIAEVEETHSWMGNPYYFRLSFTTNEGVKYYLTRSNGSSTITTTPPTNVTGDGYGTGWNTTIWSGVLYRGTSKGAKIDALKTAVGTFINEIHHNDLYDDNNNRRKDEEGHDTSLGNQISIVKFAGDTYYRNGQTTSTANTDEGDDTYQQDGYTYNVTQVVKKFSPTATNADVTALTNAVNGLNAAGGTAADYGMNLARLLIANELGDDRSESTKTVVLFTDGEPNHGQGFDSSVASDAINHAKTLKGTYDVTVFSIGVFDSISGDLDKYMNYVSSNYPDATNMSQPGNPISTDPEKLVYYQNASGADLSEIFKTVAQSSGGSGNTEVSGGSTVTVDVVASSFSLPEGVTADDITVTVAKCTGKQSKTWVNEDGETITKDYLTFGTPNVSTAFGLPAIEPTVEPSTNTVSTTGFDFSANWCGYNEDTKQYQGYKQIISFEIKVRPDAVGGPNVATNDSKSGIYVNGTQVAEFNRPHVKIPVSIWIKKQGLLGEDSAVFNIRYAPYRKGVDPTEIPKNQWTSFTKVMISKDSPKDPKDGLPMEKLVGLDPDFFYRIDEDAWAWSYNYQDNGTQYTVGEDLVNPFLFTNTPKETVREAEATVRNEFEKKSTTE